MANVQLSGDFTLAKRFAFHFFPAGYDSFSSEAFNISLNFVQ